MICFAYICTGLDVKFGNMVIDFEKIRCSAYMFVLWGFCLG